MTDRLRVLVSNLMMLKERDRFDAALRALGAEPVWPEVSQFMNEEQCLAHAGDIDVWAAGDDQITRKVLEAYLPRLRGIAKWGTGIDSIDLTASRELNLPVLNSPGAFSEAVAEVAIGYMLGLTRHLFSIHHQIRQGGWPKPQGLGLYGRMLGQIGFGAIGQGIARRAQGCGMTVIAHDPPMMHLGEHAGARLVSLEELLAEADIVCLACNLTPETRHLIDAVALSVMKREAVLVNVSRGPVVDETALVAALSSGRIAGAGLDVFETEPLPADSALRKFDNVILGSHNANNLLSAVEYVHGNTMNNIMKLLS